ncbi:glycoside hydrolase [Meira miltonrushii]|uniref:non-reducing end alpha-L-arabinofuranosidase n=1 Tax=Meira miltonrushii TaxID=1280837 RepID=A0A316V4J7_9BASI|nr:glycoside hydrolase [Meira miltonrushii]PWN31411.1 glycoside hydrolase [Meira miltonrushii]
MAANRTTDDKRTSNFLSPSSSGLARAFPLEKRAEAQTLTISGQSVRESKFGLGVFIENNINYGTDGGIYAELIRNRAFQDGGNSDNVGSGTLEFWSENGDASLTLTEESPLSDALPNVFPPTWEGTTARQDLAQLLADLKPIYFRLPGGNTLEGNSLKQRFVWNNTVGSLPTRPGRKGTWAGWDTDGYGLHEAYDLFTKMGAEPILGVFAGYTLNGVAVPQDQLQPYVDSVSDEINYLTDTSGTWADKRTADGQADPWKLPWVEIGNEDYLSTVGNDTYNEYRYDAFSEAVKSANNQPGIISSSAYYTPKDKLQAIDQHDYDVPQSLIQRWSERDSWPRNGTQIPELEFSALNSGLCSGDIYNNECRLKDPTLMGALSEATFMMGLERNGDISFSAMYAPLFKNEASSQWTPDLIAFDILNSVKTTSYYTQYGFGNNRIAQVHNVTATMAPGPVYWSVGTPQEKPDQFVIKLTNVEDSPQDVVIQLENGKAFTLSDEAQLWQMAGTDAQAANTISSPNTIVPTQRAISASDLVNGALHLTLPAYSFAIVNINSS